MECSLKAGSTFNVQFTERVEAAQCRANLAYLSIGFHTKQLRQIHYPIQEIKDLESMFWMQKTMER